MYVYVCINVLGNDKKKKKENRDSIVLLGFLEEIRVDHVVARLPLRERARHGHHEARFLSSSVTGSSSTPGGAPSPSTLAKET
jgi:hypothetical protein